MTLEQTNFSDRFQSVTTAIAGLKPKEERERLRAQNARRSSGATAAANDRLNQVEPKKKLEAMAQHPT